MSRRMLLDDIFREGDAVATESIEAPLCAYLQVFDGESKDFSKLRPHLNELFSDDLIYCVDGKPIDRETFICLNKHLLESRMIATLEDIYFSDDNHIEYTVHWGNDHISVVTHVTGLVIDGKIIKVEPCPETSSVFANIFLGCNWKSAIAMRVDKRLMSLKELQMDKRLTKLKEWALTSQRASRAA